MDVSVQCCMVDWSEEVSFVPYFAPLREDDLETDALGRKCPNFYSLPGEDKKCKSFQYYNNILKYHKINELILVCSISSVLVFDHIVSNKRVYFVLLSFFKFLCSSYGISLSSFIICRRTHQKVVKTLGRRRSHRSSGDTSGVDGNEYLHH